VIKKDKGKKSNHLIHLISHFEIKKTFVKIDFNFVFIDLFIPNLAVF